MRSAWWLAVALIASACGVGTSETSTTAPAPSTTSTSSTTASIAPAETTTTEAAVVELREIVWPDDSQRLSVDRNYRFDLEGVSVSVRLPTEHWEVLGYEQGAALFGWRGDLGFRPETLDVLIFDVSDDGTEEAWSRIEALGQADLDDVNESWTWTDQGTSTVAGIPVEWREIRIPNVRPVANNPRVVALTDVGRAVLWADTTARFYVVPVEDLTVTVVAFETRCSCSFETSWSRSGHVDDEENELSMWLDQLEGFLSAVTFEGA